MSKKTKTGVRARKLFEPKPEFPESGRKYVIYTAGCCDEASSQKPGGAAYTIHSGDVAINMRCKGFLNTTTNRMEMLAIISACKALPAGSYADIYTNSQNSVLWCMGRGKSNGDLIELYKLCSEHLLGVNLHWVKASRHDARNVYVRKLAKRGLREIRERFNIHPSQNPAQTKNKPL